MIKSLEGHAIKSKRLSVEQVVGAIKQHKAKLYIAKIVRKMGIAEGTFYLRY